MKTARPVHRRYLIADEYKAYRADYRSEKRPDTPRIVMASMLPDSIQ